MPFYEALFVLMPLMHSEDAADGELCIQIFEKIKEKITAEGKTQMLGELNYFIKFGNEHLDIVKRFGRYPTRNEALGRENTPEETEFLKTAAKYG